MGLNPRVILNRIAEGWNSWVSDPQDQADLPPGEPHLPRRDRSTQTGQGRRQ